jgi:flagellar hook-basal body complex protein FliE
MFGKALQQIGEVLGRADAAEDAFASGRGQLGAAIYERAQADVVLSIATAAAQRSTQALQSILNMQV